MATEALTGTRLRSDTHANRARGATFIAGRDGERYERNPVEFCPILSGRAVGARLLTRELPF